MCIEKIHEENISYIRALGVAALAEINQKADDIMLEMDYEHNVRMVSTAIQF